MKIKNMLAGAALAAALPTVIGAVPAHAASAPTHHDIAVYGSRVDQVGRLRAGCLDAQNMTGDLKVVQAVADGNQQTHRYGSLDRKNICVVLPKTGCPRIYLWEKTATGRISEGFFPSCGVRWQSATDSTPLKATSRVNNHQRPWQLQVYRNGHLKQSTTVAPGERGSVTHSFAHKWVQHIQLVWKPKGAAVKACNVLLNARLWRV